MRPRRQTGTPGRCMSAARRYGSRLGGSGGHGAAATPTSPLVSAHGPAARLGVPRTPVGIPTRSPQASAEDLGRRGRCIIHAPWARSSMAEQLTLNQRVEGSSPSGLTTACTHETTPGVRPAGGLFVACTTRRTTFQAPEALLWRVRMPSTLAAALSFESFARSKAAMRSGLHRLPREGVRRAGHGRGALLRDAPHRAARFGHAPFGRHPARRRGA